MKENPNLQQILEPTITAMGYEWVGCQLLRQGSGGLLRVFVDIERGMTVDDCAKISRQISALLDVHDPISGNYTLEVSSPGLERPFFNLKQVARFIGQIVSVRLYTPIDGRRNFQGEILSVEENALVLNVEGLPVTLLWSDVSKANLVLVEKKVKK